MSWYHSFVCTDICLGTNEEHNEEAFNKLPRFMKQRLAMASNLLPYIVENVEFTINLLNGFQSMIDMSEDE